MESSTVVSQYISELERKLKAKTWLLDLSTLAFFGITGPVWTFPVTYHFGERVAGRIKTNTKSTAIAFVIVSGVSSAFLFARLGNAIMKRLYLRDDILSRESTTAANRKRIAAAWVCLIIVAMITSIPSTYESNKDYRRLTVPILSSLITLVTLFNLSVKNTWAFNNVFSLLSTYYKLSIRPRLVGDCQNWANARRTLRHRLQYMRSKITSDTVTDQDLDKANFSDRYASILPLADENNLSTQIDVPKQLISCVGALTGIVGAYYSFVLGQKGGMKFLNEIIGFDEATSAKLSHGFGVLAYTFNASLFMYTTYATFGRFYDALKNWRQNISVGGVSYHAILLLIALIGGAPVAEMTYEHINTSKSYAPFVIAAAVIGMSSSKYWAMNGLLKSIKMSNVKKVNLYILDSLCRIVPDLTDNAVGELQAVAGVSLRRA